MCKYICEHHPIGGSTAQTLYAADATGIKVDNGGMDTPQMEDKARAITVKNRMLKQQKICVVLTCVCVILTSECFVDVQNILLF